MVSLGALLIFSLPQQKALDQDHKGIKYLKHVTGRNEAPKSKRMNLKSSHIILYMLTFSSVKTLLVSDILLLLCPDLLPAWVGLSQCSSA